MLHRKRSCTGPKAGPPLCPESRASRTVSYRNVLVFRRVVFDHDHGTGLNYIDFLIKTNYKILKLCYVLIVMFQCRILRLSYGMQSSN